MSTETEPQATGPIDRDELLGEAIEVYLELAEGGAPPEVEEFARRYPEISDDLVAALEGLALVQGLVGESNGPGHRLEEGRRVAGYRIVKELGRGGMGIVYEAVHVALDRPVALKVLGTQAAPDSSGRRRFLNEAKTAAGLHHTHIVPVWDVGQVGGLCYYAMQRIEGSGLDRVLRTMRRDRSVAAGSTLGSGSRKTGASPAPKPSPRPGIDGSLGASGLGDDTRTWGGLGDVSAGGSFRKREPEDAPPTFTPPRGTSYYRWVADVGRQAAEALAHAHQRGVIHRDIKPSNLLVDARGMIWVADFGLARRLADPSQTQFDSMLGTPRYMSPEQARTGVLDGRSDIYSLGATLYELITLRPPFDGQSAAELIDQIKTKEPARPRKFDPKVPLDLETILLKALGKSASDRYASADELAEDLARFLAHEPVKARRIGPIGRLIRFSRRHPSLTAVSTAAAVTVLTTATVAYVRIADERDRADEAAAIALKAKAEVEQTNQILVTQSRQLRSSMLSSLERQGANLLLSKDTDRRSRGLSNLKEATELKPDAALTVKFRDQALALLSMRDVEKRPAIETRDKPLHGLIFGADGQQILGLAEDGTLGTWDLANGKLAASSRDPIGPGRFRPNTNGGRGGGGGPGGGGPGGGGGGGRGRPNQNRTVVQAGDRLAIIKPDRTGVRLVDPAAPDKPVNVLELKGQEIQALYASTDGRRLLTLSRPFPSYLGRSGPPDLQDEARITLWDRDHLESPRSLMLPPLKVEQATTWGSQLLLAIAPDGSRVAAARLSDSEVTLWDGEGQKLPPVEVQSNTTSLALGPVGLLAVAGTNGEMALWDLSLAKPKYLRSLNLHQSSVRMIRFSPRNGSLLAATGMGGGIELWDLVSHTQIADLPTKEMVDDLVFSPDGQTLAAGQPSRIEFWSVVEPTGQYVLPETGDTPRGLVFGPGDILAITSTDANGLAPLRLWGGPGRCPPTVHAWDQIRPASVGFDKQGKLICLEPDALRWYRPPSPLAEREVELPEPGRPGGDRPGGDRPGGDRPGGDRPGGDRPAPNGVRMPPASIVSRTADGQTLLINRNGFLVWRAEDPSTFKRVEFPDRDGPARGLFGGPLISLDPSGSRIYYVSLRNEQVKLIARTLEGNEAQKTLWSLNLGPISHLAVSPDGKIVAAGERTGAITLIDTSRGIVKERLFSPDGETSPVESLAFSPDSRTLAVGTRDQVRLWAVDGKPWPLVRLPGHRGSIRSLAFDTKGTRLAGADDKTIKVWDLAALRVELSRLSLNW